MKRICILAVFRMHVIILDLLEPERETGINTPETVCTVPELRTWMETGQLLKTLGLR